MEIKNVWKDVKAPLEMHEDNRGAIADMFYNQDINAITIIKSKKGVRRGDHYHKLTTQHCLITKGEMLYVYQPVDKSQPIKYILMREGDMVSTHPLEIHTLLFPSDNEFVVFSSGLRGGKDYEKDTYRVEPLILPKEISKFVSADKKLERQKHEVRK